METDNIGNYVCRFCRGSFTQAQHLYKHVQQIHAASPSTKTSRTCPICGTVFAKYEGYRTHLRHIHGQRNEGQIFAFKCFNDFYSWKTELENRNSCKYSLQSAPKVLSSDEKIHVYQCDQSASSPKKKKAYSSNESCPAMICATESLKNHEIKVEYWNTHFGHCAPAEEDELNAAINSVQTEGSAQMSEVMDMLNSIGQNIETGPEMFVTDTVEISTSSVTNRHQNNKKSTPYVRKKKSSVSVNTNTVPIVQNFSFKKDPSKKKESSIYSLASVACGKVSANKLNMSKPTSLSTIAQTSGNKTIDKINNFTNIFVQSAKKNSNLSKIIVQTPISEILKKANLPKSESIKENTSLASISKKSQNASSISQSLVNKKVQKNNSPPKKPIPIKPKINFNSNNLSQISASKTAKPTNVSLSSLQTISSPQLINICTSSLSKTITSSETTNIELKTLSQNLASETLKHCDDISSMFEDKNDSDSGSVIALDDERCEDITISDSEVELVNDAPADKHSTKELLSIKKITSDKVIDNSKNSNSKAKESISFINKKITAPMPSPKKGVSLIKNSKSKKSIPNSPIQANQITEKSKSVKSNISQPHSLSSPVAKQSSQIVVSNASNLNFNQLTSVVSNNAVNAQTSSVSPIAASYVSINGQMVPVLNAPPSVLPSNVNSNNLVYTAVSLRPINGKLPNVSIPNFVPMIPGNMPRGILNSSQILTTTIGTTNTPGLIATNPLLQSTPTGSPLFLIPYPVNPALSKVVQATQSSTISSPLVIQNTRPFLTLPTSTTASKSILQTALLQNPVRTFINRPISQFAASTIGIAKPTLPVTTKGNTPSFPEKSSISSGVEKVSLINSTKSENSKLITNTTNSNTSKSISILKNPPLNIPSISSTGIQKPGSYVFESAGDFYMLEPVEDDPTDKDYVPSTSTPKKGASPLNFESHARKKRKDSQKTLAVSPSKSKKLKIEYNIEKDNSNLDMVNNKVAFLSETEPNISDKNETTVSLKNTIKSVETNKQCDEFIKEKNPTKHSNSSDTVPQTEIDSSEISDTKEIPSLDIKTLTSSATFTLAKLSSSPLLTVKTVPSYSHPQNRTLSSNLSFSRNLMSSSTTTTSSSPNCISSLLTKNDKIKDVEKEETSKMADIKKGVTIKSVAQEKRYDEDDLEVIKKVKFYKLEMKYFSCQEQCQKLKIELAKANSKNKELIQEIEKLKENKEKNTDLLVQDKIDDLDLNDVNIASDNDNPVQDDINDLDFNDVNKASDEENELIKKDLTSDDIQTSHKEEFQPDVPDNQETLIETIQTEIEQKEMDVDKANLNLKVDENIQSPEIDFGEEMMDVNIKEENVYSPATDLDLDGNLEVKTELVDAEESESNLQSAKTEVDTNRNTSTDVYTMVKTSVLRNLNEDLEDLINEKKRLQNIIENYQMCFATSSVPLDEIIKID